MMRTIYFLLSTFCVFALKNTTVMGQANPLLEDYFKPLVIWIYPDAMHEDVSREITALKEHEARKFKWLLLRDSMSADSKNQIMTKVNDYLNEETGIDKQKIYVLEWSTIVKKQYFEESITDIIADSYFFYLGQGLENFDLEAILQEFKNKHIWAITLFNIREKSLIHNPQLRKFSYGLTYGNMNQYSINEDSLYFPSSIRKMGFTIGYRINPRLYLFGRGLFSFKIPNQSNLQSTLLNQLDMDAGGVQTISIEIKAHVFIQGTVQVNYFLTQNRRIQPFVGAGMSNINSRSAKIKEEVEIDVDDIFSGGGPPTGLSSGIGEGELPFFVVRTADPFITAGLSVRMFKNVYWMTSAEYHFSNRKEVNDVKIENRHQSYSLNMGIQFEFQKRQRKYYQYLN